jgi:hypothetical protein
MTPLQCCHFYPRFAVLVTVRVNASPFGKLSSVLAEHVFSLQILNI